MAEDMIIASAPTGGSEPRNHTLRSESSCVRLAFIRPRDYRPLVRGSGEETASALATDTAFVGTAAFAQRVIEENKQTKGKTVGRSSNAEKINSILHDTIEEIWGICVPMSSLLGYLVIHKRHNNKQQMFCFVFSVHTSHFILLQISELVNKFQVRIIQIPAFVQHLCLHHILMRLEKKKKKESKYTVT